MAPHDDEDDLFQHTSMSFGEHLEELRSALFKAVISLVIGFVIGLVFGSWIVGQIQSPLVGALRTYYQNQSLVYINERLPPELRDDPEVEATIREGLLPEVRYVSAEDLLEALRQRYPQALSGAPLTAEPLGTAPDAGNGATGNGATPVAASDASPEAAAKHAEPVTPRQLEKEAAAQQVVSSGRFSKEEMIPFFVWRPLSEDERLKLDVLSVQEPFVIYLKASFLFGAILSSPFVFYFLWQFVAAGLYPHEKRYIHLFLPVSVCLFLVGASLAFFFVFPPVLGYLFGIGDALGIQMRPRLSEWLGFVLLLPLGFGVAFQLPLLMLFLERIHVFSVGIYLSKWRIAVLLMAIASMVLSPGGDPISMMMLLIPLVGLYFGGIALCHFLPETHARTPKRKVDHLARVD